MGSIILLSIDINNESNEQFFFVRYVFLAAFQRHNLYGFNQHSIRAEERGKESCQIVINICWRRAQHRNKAEQKKSIVFATFAIFHTQSLNEAQKRGAHNTPKLRNDNSAKKHFEICASAVTAEKNVHHSFSNLNLYFANRYAGASFLNTAVYTHGVYREDHVCFDSANDNFFPLLILTLCVCIRLYNVHLGLMFIVSSSPLHGDKREVFFYILLLIILHGMLIKYHKFCLLSDRDCIFNVEGGENVNFCWVQNVNIDSFSGWSTAVLHKHTSKQFVCKMCMATTQREREQSIK